MSATAFPQFIHVTPESCTRMVLQKFGVSDPNAVVLYNTAVKITNLLTVFVMLGAALTLVGNSAGWLLCTASAYVMREAFVKELHLRVRGMAPSLAEQLHEYLGGLNLPQLARSARISFLGTPVLFHQYT